MSFFANHGIFVLPSALGKARVELFRRRITENGGTSFDEFDSLLTSTLSIRVVVVEDAFAYETVFKILKLAKKGYSLTESPREFRIVTSKWLSECLREKRVAAFDEHAIVGAPLVTSLAKNDDKEKVMQTKPGCSGEGSHDDDELPFKVPKMSEPRLGAHIFEDKAKPATWDASPRKIHDDTDQRGDNEQKDSDAEADASCNKSEESDIKLPPGNWLCSQASARTDKPSENPNLFVIDQLQQLCQVYKTTKDQWRQLSYQKAISGVISHPSFSRGKTSILMIARGPFMLGSWNTMATYIHFSFMQPSNEALLK